MYAEYYRRQRWKDNLSILLLLLLIAIFLGIGIWYTREQWRECMNFGHSSFYCLKHIS